MKALKYNRNFYSILVLSLINTALAIWLLRSVPVK